MSGAWLFAVLVLCLASALVRGRVDIECLAGLTAQSVPLCVPADGRFVDNITGSHLGPDGARALAPALAKLTQLQTLDLKSEWIVCTRVCIVL